MGTIVIRCNNAAVRLKNELMNFMEKKGYTVGGMRRDSIKDSTYYPYVAEEVRQEIIDSGYQKHGVLICSIGLGMAMTVNRSKGTCAGVYHDILPAERLKLSNDGSVIYIDERVVGTELAKRTPEKWLELDFVDCASAFKVEVIKETKGENLKQRRRLDEKTESVVSWHRHKDV